MNEQTTGDVGSESGKQQDSFPFVSRKCFFTKNYSPLMEGKDPEDISSTHLAADI